MKKKVMLSLAFLLASVSALQAFAFNVEFLFSSDMYAELKEKGMIERISFMEDGAAFSLNPETPLAKEVLDSWPEDLPEPNFYAEEIYLAKKSDLGNPGQATIEYAGKLLRSFSTIQGIKYYSHSKGRETVLYEEAYTVEPERNPATGNIIKVGEKRGEDNLAGSADGKTVYALMDDSSLGRTVYRVDYEERADEIRAYFVNESSLKLGPIKAFSPGKLRMNFVVSDCGDYIVAYLTTQAACPPLSILDKTIKRSFSTRLASLYGWFIERL